MTNVLRFVVPGPPIPWMRAGSRNGQRFTPPRQRQYQRLVRDVAATAMRVADPARRIAGIVTGVVSNGVVEIAIGPCPPVTVRSRGEVNPSELVVYGKGGRVERIGRSVSWPLTARYAVTLVATYADRRHRDIDRIANQILDALNGVAWADDSQVDELHVSRLLIGEPRLDVTITVMHATERDPMLSANVAR